MHHNGWRSPTTASSASVFLIRVGLKRLNGSLNGWWWWRRWRRWWCRRCRVACLCAPSAPLRSQSQGSVDPPHTLANIHHLHYLQNECIAVYFSLLRWLCSDFPLTFFFFVCFLVPSQEVIMLSRTVWIRITALPLTSSSPICSRS